MEVIESIANQERYITFDEAGSYTIRMAAVSGKQVVEQTRTIYVGGNDGSVPMAKLLVSYEAVKVERFIKPERIYVGWQGDTKPASVSFRRERMAETGATIQSAELVNQGAGAPVKNVKCEIAPDKSKIILTGELVRPTGPLAKDGAAPHWVAELKVAQERRGPKRTINRGDVAMTVDWNSTVRIPMQPLPDGYEIVAKKVTLQLWDGPRKAWEGNKAVTNAQVTMNNKTCLVTAVPQSDSFLVSLSSPGPVLQPVGFERNPLKLPKQK
jgi:hypothetical protein